MIASSVGTISPFVGKVRLAYNIIVILIGATLFYGSVSWADAESGNDAKSIVSRLSDEEVRRLLLEKLSDDSQAGVEVRVDPRFNPAQFAHWATVQVIQLGLQLQGVWGAADELPTIFRLGADLFNKEREDNSSGRDLLIAVGSSFAFGAIAVLSILAFLYNVELRFGGTDISDTVLSTSEKLKCLAFAVAKKIFLLLIFSAVAAAVFALFFNSESRDHLAFFSSLSAAIVIGLGIVFFHAFCYPGNAQLRLPLFTGTEATIYFLTAVCTIVFGAVAFFNCAFINMLGVGARATASKLAMKTVAYS